MGPIPTIFIDVHPVFRQIATRVLERYFADTITLVAEGDHWPLAIPSAAHPQVVLLGLGAEGLVDPQCLAAIRTAIPGVVLVVLGLLDDPPYRAASLAAGADAFISKSEIGTWLIPVIRQLTAHVPEHA